LKEPDPAKVAQVLCAPRAGFLFPKASAETHEGHAATRSLRQIMIAALAAATVIDPKIPPNQPPKKPTPSPPFGQGGI
jgi:hypothetical protein